MFRNLVYDKAFRYAPVSIQNRYYKYANQHNARAWLDAPFFLIHTPKAAGTSICKAVGLPDSTHLLFREFDTDLARKLAQKPCLMIVRDPIDRLISTYTYLRKAHENGIRNLMQFIGEYETLDTFLQDVAAKPTFLDQYFLRPSSAFYRSALDFGADVQLIDFEDLNRDVPKFLHRFGYQMNKIPRQNVSSSESVKRPQVSVATEMAIREIYQSDYELLDRIRAC